MTSVFLQLLDNYPAISGFPSLLSVVYVAFVFFPFLKNLYAALISALPPLHIIGKYIALRPSDFFPFG